MKDLFGYEIVRAALPSAKKKPKKNGYPSPPGSGPEGEKCKTCVHAYAVETRSGKRFWKCNLVQGTRGPGTDIRLKSPACNKWQADGGIE